MQDLQGVVSSATLTPGEQVGTANLIVHLTPADRFHGSVETDNSGNRYTGQLRAGMGLGWMFVVAAEFMGASTGLGFLLIDGQQLGKPAQIVAAIVAFAILGKATDWLIVLLSAPFLRWEDRFAQV
jgi:hypothetical protein